MKWTPAEAPAGKFFILKDWNHSDGPLRDGIDGTPIPAERLKAIRRQVPSGDATALARWEDGEPFITRRIVDHGTAWFVGSLPDYTWSNLGDADVLLPTVQRVIAAGADRFDASYLTTVGSDAAQPLPGKPAPGSMTTAHRIPPTPLTRPASSASANDSSPSTGPPRKTTRKSSPASSWTKPSKAPATPCSTRPAKPMIPRSPAMSGGPSSSPCSSSSFQRPSSACPRPAPWTLIPRFQVREVEIRGRREAEPPHRSPRWEHDLLFPTIPPAATSAGRCAFATGTETERAINRTETDKRGEERHGSDSTDPTVIDDSVADEAEAEDDAKNAVDGSNVLFHDDGDGVFPAT